MPEDVQSASAIAGRFVDFWLFLHALRLGWAARRIHQDRTLQEMASSLPQQPLLPRRVEERDSIAAAVRACTRLERWFGIPNTCLSRALVAGSMLSDTREVWLHIGASSSRASGTLAEGHAWLSVDGVVLETSAEGTAIEHYTEIHRLSLRRG